LRVTEQMTPGSCRTASMVIEAEIRDSSHTPAAKRHMRHQR